MEDGNRVEISQEEHREGLWVHEDDAQILVCSEGMAHVFKDAFRAAKEEVRS